MQFDKILALPACIKTTILLVAFGLVACSEKAAVPTPTEATCPPDFTLTYENFGRPFMEKYCVRCHSSELRGSARNGAPLFHDFDTLLGILQVANHVDWYTAIGPAAANDIMPPNGAIPSATERTQLGEWLVCEVDNFGMSPDAGSELDAGSTADASPGVLP